MVTFIKVCESEAKRQQYNSLVQGPTRRVGSQDLFTKQLLADGGVAVMFKTKLMMLGGLFFLLVASMLHPTASAQFIHPGGLHTQADLDRMKAKVATGAHPWIDDWNLLIVDPQAQTTYKGHSTTNMGSSRQNADLDAHAAYLNALRWYISGDTSFADAAVNLLNSWSSKVNVVPTGTDTPGLIAIPIQDFNLAAEILRLYPGWNAADIQTFKNMNTNYLYPVVNNFLTNHNGACISNYWTNWDASNIGALIAMGVFNDNTAWFDQGVAYYQNGPGTGSINNAVWVLYNNGALGQWEEAGRDQEHDQLGVGLLGYAAQTAWNQGVDLFGYNSNRLLAGAEYTAQYNMDLPVPYTTYENCLNVNNFTVSTNGRGRLDDRPVWELLYNHYNVLQGVSTPNTKAMAELMRPEHGSTDHFGYGTLTFTLNDSVSPYPPAPIPPAPTGLAATASVSKVYLDWDRVPASNSYNVMRSSGGAAYTNIASLTQTTLTNYTDTSVTNGTEYSYQVEAVNQSGIGTDSPPASATPMASGALPSDWLDVDIGTVQTAGSATYASVGNGTFLVTGQGAGLSGHGTTDSYNFAYQKVTGNFVLTARITSIAGTKLNRSGLLMIGTPTPADPAVALTIGNTGWRYAELGFRQVQGGSTTGSTGNMNWYQTGNQYTNLPEWFKLQRVGNTFSGYQSDDGINWFLVKTTTEALPTTYYAGFMANSGDTSKLTTETTTFDNVSVAAGLTPTVTVTPATSTVSLNTPLTLTVTVTGISVQEAAATGTVTLSGGGYTAAPGTLDATGTYTFTIPADSLNPGTNTFTVTYSGDSNYLPGTGTASTVVTQLTPTVTVTPNLPSVLLLNPVTFTAEVSTPVRTATGSVSFLDGTTVLSTVPLANAIATFTTTLSLGTHNISVLYSGDTNFSVSTSSTLAEPAITINIGPVTSGMGGTGSGSGAPQTVSPGGTASYQVPITPSTGASFPTDVTFTVTGVPSGAVVAVTPSIWIKSNSTSWTLAANTVIGGNTQLNITVPSTVASTGTQGSKFSKRMKVITLALLLFPFAGCIRKAGTCWGAVLSMFAVLLAGATATIVITGCSSAGSSSHNQSSMVIVTVSSGPLSKSTSLTLTIQR